jgi:hypothetical protein
MTNDEKAKLLRACKLAEEISENTELGAQVDYDPCFKYMRFEARWFRFVGSRCIKTGAATGIENLCPYLETVLATALQTDPRKAPVKA